VPIEILAQASPKEPTNDAMPKFIQAYTSHSRVATLVKETQTGKLKLVKEWETALASANSKPDLIDMAPSISSMLAVKDDEELVRCCFSSLFV
jgi:nucleosome binding factor SPN SPT16 subunit